jgi:hypothetical protein
MIVSVLAIHMLAPSPVAVLVSALPSLWIAHRAEGLWRVLRASLVGRGMRMVRLLRVGDRGITVSDEGRESVLDVALADPRDGTVEASRALGPLTWAAGDPVLIAAETTRVEGYRAASPRRTRAVVSPCAVGDARRAFVLTLLAMLVLGLGAAVTASYRSLVPALARLQHPPPAAHSESAR